MILERYLVKLQSCNISNALLRNINDHFKNVSFEFLSNGDLQVRLILKKYSENEKEMIEDFITELSALQQSNCVLEPEVFLENSGNPLKYIVFNKLM